METYSSNFFVTLDFKRNSHIFLYYIPVLEQHLNVYLKYEQHCFL